MQSELIGRTGVLVVQRTMAERIKPSPVRSQALMAAVDGLDVDLVEGADHLETF